MRAERGKGGGDKTCPQGSLGIWTRFPLDSLNATGGKLVFSEPASPPWRRLSLQDATWSSPAELCLSPLGLGGSEMSVPLHLPGRASEEGPTGVQQADPAAAALPPT